MKNFLISAVAITACMALQAEVKLPNYLSDNMIVQRNATLKVSGTAAPGSTVSVTPEWSGKTVKAKAGADGKFVAKVATPEAGGPWMLEVTDGTAPAEDVVTFS